MRPRVYVQGEQRFLEQEAVSDRIRTLLLAGIRSVVLWEQKGGGRLELMLRPPGLSVCCQGDTGIGMNKLALVTGATGFVGQHLLRVLLDNGYQVRCLVRRELSSEFADSSGVETVYGDLNDLDALRQASAGAEYVFHVAGATGAHSEAEYHLTNVMGTRNLVDALLAVQAPLQRFVFLSSQAAAGPSHDRPRNEGDVEAPITPYGRSKLEAEQFLRTKSKHLPYLVLRPAAVFGPGDKAFLPIFRLLERKILIQLGSVDRIVSLCHVSDLAELMVSAVDAKVPNGSTYFVAEPSPFRWSELERQMALAIDVQPRRIQLGQKLLNWQAGSAS